MHVIPFITYASFSSFHFDTHTHEIMHNFFLLFVVYCDLDLEFAFFSSLLLIQTIQIHFSVHLIFLLGFFRGVELLCVFTHTHIHTHIYRNSYESNIMTMGDMVAGSLICQFSMPNRGYDFPMREHLTLCFVCFFLRFAGGEGIKLLLFD